MNTMLMKHPTDPNATLSCGKGPNAEGLIEVDPADVGTALAHGFVQDPAAGEKAAAEAAKAEADAKVKADAEAKAKAKSKKSEE